MHLSIRCIYTTESLSALGGMYKQSLVKRQVNSECNHAHAYSFLKAVYKGQSIYGTMLVLELWPGARKSQLGFDPKPSCCKETVLTT